MPPPSPRTATTMRSGPRTSRPLAVVLAESTDDVAAIVTWCAANGVAVVPRGSGTGLSGGANAVADSIVLSLERMTRGARDRRRRALRGRAGRRDQRQAARIRRREGSLVSARSRELGHLDHRRQCGDQRRRHLLREVRRDPRLRARHDRRAGRRSHRAAGAPHGQGRRRLRPHRAHGRLGGHPRHHHRTHAQAAAARRAGGARRGRVLPVAARGRSRRRRDRPRRHHPGGARAHRPHLPARRRRLAAVGPARATSTPCCSRRSTTPVPRATRSPTGSPRP